MKKKPANVENPKWNPSARVRAFLAAFKATASVTRAAKAAGIGRSAHYRLLERSPGYRAAFQEAERIAADAIEDEAVRRAMEGEERQVLYHGMPAMELVDPNDPDKGLKARVERERSDALIALLLKAKKPREYRDRVEHDVGPELAKKFDGTFEELLATYRNLISTPEKDEK